MLTFKELKRVRVGSEEFNLFPSPVEMVSAYVILTIQHDVYKDGSDDLIG